MQNYFRQLRQAVPKPILFGFYGAVGCLTAATLMGEVFLALTKLPPKIQRSPQAVVLLIDCSGSMDGGKLSEVKSAAQGFVQRQNLGENRLAVVGFGSDVHVGANLSADKNVLAKAITQLSDGGGTRIDIAIQAAAQELHPTSLQRNILLFTDGQPGYQGASPEEEQSKTLQAAQLAKSQGINLVAVATGDADTNFLTQVTGERSRVFFTNSGDFDQAFQQAEKAIYSSQLVESGQTGDYGLLYAGLRIGGWTALLALGTSLALIAGQNHYLHRRVLTIREGSIGTVGSLTAGLAAGAISQILFTPVAGIPLLAIIGRIAGWTILGTLLGGCMSFFVPNLESRRALLGGGIGGGFGAIGFLLAGGAFGDIIGRLLGAAVLGFFIGLMIALLEVLSREAWLIVHWTPVEQTKISLGDKPVILGSSDEAHIYLPKEQGYPPITAKIYQEKQKIIMQFDPEMQQLKGMKVLRHELVNDERRKLAGVLIEVKTAQ